MELKALNIKPHTLFQSDTTFFGAFALIITFVVFGGFTLSWVSNPGSFGRMSFWTSLHGLFSAAWYILLLSQIRLSAKNNLNAHKMLGKLSVLIVVGIFFSGSTMAVEFYHRLAGFGVFDPNEIQGRIRAGAFLGGAFFQWLIFLTLYILGILWLKKPEHHKRFMLAASIQMMPEGLNRIAHNLALPGYSMYVFMFLIYTTLVVYDWKVKGRVYASTLVSLGLFCVLILAMNTVFQTQVWGDWIVGLINNL